MPDLPNPVTLAIPAFIGLMVLEAWLMRRRRAYHLRDTVTSIALGLGSQVAGLVSAGAIYGIAVWVGGWAPVPLGWAWWLWPLCFVLDDLAYYWFHRSAHRIRWFWASHVVHHSSEHYNLSTALRQTWTGFISLSFLFRLPLFLAGFPPAMVFVCAGANLVYQFWIHTEMVGRLPRPIEAVMNTPSHHRAHHGRNPRYLDTNYAGVFIVWDRLFGTFEAESDDDAPDYGLVAPLGHFNVLRAATHEWIGIARDVWTAPDWRSRLGYMLREPGWSHDGSRETSAQFKERWLATRESELCPTSSTSSLSAAGPPDQRSPAG